MLFATMLIVGFGCICRPSSSPICSPICSRLVAGPISAPPGRGTGPGFPPRRCPSKPRRRRHLTDRSADPSGDRKNDPGSAQPTHTGGLRCPHRRQPGGDPTEVSPLGHVYVHLPREEATERVDRAKTIAESAYPSSFFRAPRETAVPRRTTVVVHRRFGA